MDTETLKFVVSRLVAKSLVASKLESKSGPLELSKAGFRMESFATTNFSYKSVSVMISGAFFCGFPKPWGQFFRFLLP